MPGVGTLGAHGAPGSGLGAPVSSQAAPGGPSGQRETFLNERVAAVLGDTNSSEVA